MRVQLVDQVGGEPLEKRMLAEDRALVQVRGHFRPLIPPSALIFAK